MQRFLWILAAAIAMTTWPHDTTADDVAPTASDPVRGRLRLSRGVNSDAEVIGEIRLADPIAARPLPEARRQVRFDILLLQLDWQKLQAAGIDLPELIGQPADTRGAWEDPQPMIARAVAAAQAERAAVRLLDTGAATVLSRPKVITLDGRPAHVHVGQETPVAVIHERVNGEPRQRVESLTTGEVVDLTPTILDDGELVLAINARSSRFLPAPDEGNRMHKALFKHFAQLAGTPLPPPIRTRAFNLKMTLADGEAAVLAELRAEERPAGEPEANVEAEHGLMLVVVPKVLETTAAPPVYEQPVKAAARQVSPPQPLELAAAARPTDRWPARIELREGEVRVLPAPAPQRIDGFDPAILDVHATDDDRGLRLKALSKGVTSLMLDVGAARPPVRIEVFVTGDTRQLEAYLERLYPHARIEAIEVQDSVVLRGSDVTSEQIAGIVDIAEQFYPQVLNQLEPAARPSSQLEQPRNRIAWATAADDCVAALGRRLEHIRQAAENLRSAGLDEMAGQIAAQAESVERDLARLTQPRAAAADGGDSGSADLRRQIRELRGEVQELRRDVGRLIELLEKESGSAAARSPAASRNAYSTDAFSPYDNTVKLKLAAARRWAAQGRLAEAEKMALDACRIAPADAAARELYLRIRDAAEASDAKTDQPATLGIEIDEDAEAAIRRRLHEPVSLSLQKVALADVPAKIAVTAGINVVLDQRGLEEEGVPASQVVSLNVEDVSLRSALELLLEPLDLVYRIEDEVLKITSRQRARGRMEVRNYSVADFVSGDATSAEITLESLAGLIQSVIHPNDWDSVGGSGSIRRFDKTLSLVIRQTTDVHDEVADLLGLLLKFRRARMAAEPAVTLTSGQRTGGEPETRSYAVADLVAAGPPETRLGLESLVDVICKNIDPDAWSEQGGIGSIQPYASTGSLVIRQTPDIHKEIADLLDQIRRVRTARAEPDAETTKR